ncbi:ParB/RepB/Spo0J family partition protein [Fulvimarina endophytica]|uniref:ParB/RepB/Spo0J family partition protein n=1 Tax=Fulvimarina endophytica TaxID=2293836 RepID=A0A371X5N9_9HYPH|nr:ParB/RepB/Spo0J family partition protein [Fulvimarina endophytica]RFC64537.1 ParB/RepB/Spo0J family partition protein [Fulvimarina endophytica]
MSDDRSRQRLGRGLAALIGAQNHSGFAPAGQAAKEPKPEETVRPDHVVALDRITANPNNPRRTFGEEDIADLAQSVKKHGIVQPLLVRPNPDLEGGYEIVAGERRFRAARAAGLETVPVVVRDIGNRQSIEIALIENVQRTDLNAVEEAQAYELLIEEHGYTQADLAETLAKSRSHVANMLRLLKLPTSVREMIVAGTLSPSAARTLIGSDDPETVARLIVKDGLSVREAEEIARSAANQNEAADEFASGAAEAGSPAGASASRTGDAEIGAIEERLAAHLAMRVSLKGKRSKGSLKIDYRSPEELDDILSRLGLS